jgi:lysophospholipase L1-like esterase
MSGSGAADGGRTGSLPCTIAPDASVHWVGRVDGCDERGARFAWSGSGFVGRFSGTGVSVRLIDSPNQYTVLIDAQLLDTLKTRSGDALYPLASDLSPGEHTFEMYRRTEASFGNTIVVGFEVAGGELLSPPEPPTRHIEVIGDSITCGYGDEGTLPCGFSADTENHYLSYAAILARDLNAELSTVAWSGKGVIFNYNGDPLYPMPTQYALTVPDDKKNTWPFAWKADAVVINLGTNDYSTSNDPSDTMFVDAYTLLLERVRGAYPNAFVLCTVGPLLTGADRATARKNIAAAVDARTAAGDTKLKAYEMTTLNGTPPGCDYHPNLATQAAMASELEMELRADLGW